MLLSLSLLLAGRLFTAAPETVDLSAQFPTLALRTQNDTGACHIFSTVALLEAALNRRWGLKLQLSEADLFVRRMIKSPS